MYTFAHQNTVNKNSQLNHLFMKRLLLALIIILPTLACAQKFYEPSDIQVGWKYWSSETSWNYLINNGKKLNVSCLPKLQWSGTSLTNDAEIHTTYMLNNKFIVLSFSVKEGIRLRSSNANYLLNNLNYSLSYVSTQPWYEIDFENIVYDPIFNQIMIPCGVDNNGAYNAICLSFTDNTTKVPSMTEDSEEFDEDRVKYFDLQGCEVDADTSKGKVLIKSDGRKSVKFYNK